MQSSLDQPGRRLQTLHGGGQRLASTGPQGLTLSGLTSFFLFVGVFTVSWHLVRPGELNFTVSDGAFLIAVLGLLAGSRLNFMPMGGLSTAWLFSLVTMLGALFVSTVANGDPVRWLIVATQYSFAYLLLPMMFMSFDHATLKRCVVLFVLGVTISQAIGNIANIFLDFEDTFPYLGYDFITGRGRVGALSGNANINGAMTGFAMVFLVYIVDRRLLHPLVSLVCAGFLLWGLIASASFTSFVVCLGALALAMVIRWPTRAALALLVAIAAGVAYIVSDLPLPTVFEERVLGALSGGGLEEAGTFTGRADLAAEAWRMAGDTLFVGLGADGFRDASVYQAPVHIFPLLLLTESGVFGLLGLLGLLCILWFQSLSHAAHERRWGSLCIGVLFIFTAFTLTVPHMYARQWLAPIFLALAVVASETSARAVLWRANGVNH